MRCVAHPCTRSMSYLVSEGFNVSSPGFDASVPILMKEYSALSEEGIFGSVRREVLLYGVYRVYGVYHRVPKSFSLFAL